MSKNISIQEGGISKQFTVSKLKTNTVNAGSCTWVPEDEVSLGTKSITSNGTYKASDDGKYGFSKVTVNVSGGQGSVNLDGTPNVNPIDPNDPDSKVNPGGPGTSVVGTDPVTGNDYIIGVDENGQLVTTPVPSRIEITEDPNKMDYNDGDTPDYTGLVATLKNNDGTTFTNEDYPDGTIPLSELQLSDDVLHADEGTEYDEYESDLSTNWPQPIEVYGSASFNQNVGRGPETATTVGKLLIVANSAGVAFTAIIVGSTPSLGHSMLTNIATGDVVFYNNEIAATAAVTIDGKTAYYTTTSSNSSTTWDPKPFVSPRVSPDANTVWAAVYGTRHKKGEKAVVARWKSPYDGRTFENSFDVNVTQTGSGYSDDSGGSQSGGGTDIPGGGSSSDSGGSGSGGGTSF